MVEVNVEAQSDSAVSDDGPLVSAARKVEHGVSKGVEIAREGLGKAKEKSAAAGARAKEGVEKAKQGMHEMKGKTIGEVCDDVTDYAKAHPGQTILLSVGIGALIGMLIRRR